MRLNPHLHAVVLDGAWYGQGGELCWGGLGHMKTSEVGAVLESTIKRMERHLQRRGLLRIEEMRPIPMSLLTPRGGAGSGGARGTAAIRAAATPRAGAPRGAPRRWGTISAWNAEVSSAEGEAEVWRPAVAPTRALGDASHGAHVQTLTREDRGRYLSHAPSLDPPPAQWGPAVLECRKSSSSYFIQVSGKRLCTGICNEASVYAGLRERSRAVDFLTLRIKYS